VNSETVGRSSGIMQGGGGGRDLEKKPNPESGVCSLCRRYVRVGGTATAALTGETIPRLEAAGTARALSALAKMQKVHTKSLPQKRPT